MIKTDMIIRWIFSRGRAGLNGRPLLLLMSDYGKYGDDILVGLCTRGDGRAMKVIYDRYVEYLSAVCARYISGDDDRKDVLQESFVRIFTSLDKFCFHVTA